MKRADKLALLKRVLEGHTAELEQLRARRGRPYTIEEKAAQQAYLTSLLSCEVTQDEVTRWFGLYDLSGVKGAQAYELLNGMLITNQTKNGLQEKAKSLHCVW